jgi:hypothetical protein
MPASARTASNDALNCRPGHGSRTGSQRHAHRDPSADCGSAAQSTARPGWRLRRGCERSGSRSPSGTSSTGAGGLPRSPHGRSPARRRPLRVRALQKPEGVRATDESRKAADGPVGAVMPAVPPVPGGLCPSLGSRRPPAPRDHGSRGDGRPPCRLFTEFAFCGAFHREYGTPAITPLPRYR